MKDVADATEDATNSRALEVVARAGFAVSGILHFLIGLVAIRLATGGTGKADVSGAVEQLAGQPAGPLLLAIGAAVAVTGIIYAIRGFRQSFKKYLRLPASQQAQSAVKALGVAGYAAKGIALLLAGLLIIIATVRVHPEESTGLDGGLKALREQPFGVYMLAAVGAGLICYGVFMIVRAKLAKM
ncbi:DUF1206 domain-containing protein [Arthrobacter sp. UYCu723]